MSNVIDRLKSVADHLPECASGHGACLAGIAEIERLRETLVAAKEKLVIYYQQTGALYGGGQPYNLLMKQIDAALGDQQQPPAEK